MDALRMWSHLLHQANQPSDETLLLYRQATDLNAVGRWEQAASILEGCVSELEKADAPQAAPANHNLAVVLQQRGDRDGAIFHCVRSVFLYEQVEDLGGMFAGLRNLIVIHRSRQENRLAMAAQHQAARVRELLIARGDLARVEEGRDRYGEPLVLLGMQQAKAPRAELTAVG